MPGGFGFEDEEREADGRPWYTGGTAGGTSGWTSGASSGEQPLSAQTNGTSYGERAPASGSITSQAPRPAGGGYEQPAQPAPSLYGQPEPDPHLWGATSRPLGPTSRPLQQAEPSWGGSGQYGQPSQSSRPPWGQYGQPAQPSGWGQFGQPAQPVQPSGGFPGQPGPASGRGSGYGQPAAPSGWGPSSGPGMYGSQSEWGTGPTTYGGYGTVAPPSQGWSGREVAQYVPGGYAPDRYVPGGHGLPSEYMPGGYGVYAPGWYGEGAGRGWVESSARGSSRKRVWVTLGVIAALLIVALAGAGYAVFAVFTPQAAVANFCGDLRGGHYADAYNLLEGAAQSQVTETGFAEVQVTLARVAGGIARCEVNSATTTYQYHPGDTAATIGVAIEWASAGRMTGWAHLKNDNGWKIAALDSSVFGVNLGALSAVTTYCQALVDQNYAAVYEVLGSQQRAQVQGEDYTQLGEWQDTIDGAVQACQVVHVGTSGSGNTDIVAHLPVTMTRANLGQRQDDVALEVESGTWKITSIGPQLQGTDVGGLAVGVRFCSDLAKGDYADAFTLATGAGESEDAFARGFNGQDSGIKLANCASDVSTYKVSGASATLDTEWNVERLSDGATGHGTVTESLIKLGNGWKINNLTPKQ